MRQWREICNREDVPHLDLRKEVDPDPFGLQAARLLDPHPKVLHVCIDDILHCSAKKQIRRMIQTGDQKAELPIFRQKKRRGINVKRTSSCELSRLVSRVSPALIARFVHKPSAERRSHLAFQTRVPQSVTL